MERCSEVVATRAFTRATTVVRMGGLGVEGVGEDVALPSWCHRRQPWDRTLARLRVSGTLADWLARCAELAPWPEELLAAGPARARRWALESAALDLALRQAGISLGAALGVRARPVHFVASLRLGDPPGFEPIALRAARYPALRFKLDAISGWHEALCRRLAGTGAVDVVDLKGAYRGTQVDQPADPALYERVLARFPAAVVEDPAVTAQTRGLLEPHRERLAWDAPIASVEDLARLPWPAAAVNVKPSRIGSLAGLLALYEHCAAAGIAMYGGGMFELGPGRTQNQSLASLFHPDAPNDVAPAGYNAPSPASGLPESPLQITGGAPGLGW